MYQHLQVTSFERATSVNIHRPERRNGLGVSIGRELNHFLCKFKSETDCILDRTDSITTVRALFITATSNNGIWIAGGDLKELSNLSALELSEYVDVWTQNCELLQSILVPTIAIIDGQCIGGATEFALSADLRLMTQDSSFSFKQIPVGLPFGYGTTALLRQHFGEGRTRSLILLGKDLSATELFDLGLAEKLASKENLVQEKEILCKKIDALSNHAIACQKAMFLESSALNQKKYFMTAWKNPYHSRFLEQFKKLK